MTRSYVIGPVKRNQIKPRTKPAKSGLKKKVVYTDSKGKSRNAYYKSVQTLSWVKTTKTGAAAKKKKAAPKRKVKLVSLF